jgi:Tol biopolymer transport system component/CubicO group peptidase (beta-lactamase class C family)
MSGMPTIRIHSVIGIGVLVTVGLPATLSAPARGEEPRTPPPVERVAREVGSGARSVIVFVSAGGKEYVATAGARPPKADQRFRVGSVTKTFTATLALKLVEEGKLRIDSTLENHLPGVVPRGDEITIGQLLQHRSGLVNYTDDRYLSWLQRASRSRATRPIDVLRFAGSKPLAFKPGYRGRYSNTNYIALGLVIESVTGRTYEDELERPILRPLELAHTELAKTRRLPDLKGEVPAPPGWPREVDWLNPNISWAAGAIVSNVRDVSHFYSALLSGHVLSNASLATMKETVAAGGAAGVGLGIFSNALPCGRSWGHAGGIIEYVTLVSASEAGERVAVLSIRGEPEYLPPVERALLCAESRRAADSAQATRKIAFISTSGPGPGPLYVMNADGSGQRWLTLHAFRSTPAWSPDGRRISFESVRDGNSEIYVVNADGSAQRRLTRNDVRDFAPAWSPDGRKIVFGRQRDGKPEVYVMNADGSAQRNLTRNVGRDLAPAWSPDGTKIAFVRNGDVYVMKADGSGQRRLTHTRSNAFAPAWSSDGRKLAFESVRNGNLEIYVMNADGSGRRNLTRNAARDFAPTWSPDAPRIAFESMRDGKSAVYAMNADGSRRRRLTENGAWPLWSPDGRRIAFVSKRDGNAEVYVMNADGSRQRNLTRSPWSEGRLAWSPVRKR